MECTGKLTSVSRGWKSGKVVVSFELDDEPAEDINDLLKHDKLRITADEYQDIRSNNANKMLWACLGDIAKAIHGDKWRLYLDLLKKRGRYTYICVKPSAVASMKAQFRECEEIGKIDINGEEAVQLICYFGSSTFTKKEFANLLDEVVFEMRSLGLTPPPSEDMRRVLEKWKKQNNGKT